MKVLHTLQPNTADNSGISHNSMNQVKNNLTNTFEDFTTYNKHYKLQTSKFHTIYEEND